MSADLHNFRFRRVSAIWPNCAAHVCIRLREERKDRGSTIGQKGHSLLTRLITCHYFCMKPLKPNKAKPSTDLSVVRSNAAFVSLTSVLYKNRDIGICRCMDLVQIRVSIVPGLLQFSSPRTFGLL